MSTQWRIGFQGPIGLDYNVLPLLLRVARVPRDQWRDILECVRIMEDAALAVINER